MTITKTAVTANTYGGYVNVSRQDIDWSTPSIMDLVISDLAAQYGIVTEAALGAALRRGRDGRHRRSRPAPRPSRELTGALWAARRDRVHRRQGPGPTRVLRLTRHARPLGPLFAPVNPVTAQSAGFEAANFGSGLMGAIAGIPTYMDASLAAGTNLVISSAAVEVYEDRIGSLQVVEPVRARRPGRVRGLLHLVDRRERRCRLDREDTMTEWDAPNQQVVRADESPPWQEGTGGDPGDVEPHQTRDDDDDDEPTVDEMTKAQLLAYADEHDIQVDQSLTKAEVRDG